MDATVKEEDIMTNAQFDSVLKMALGIMESNAENPKKGIHMIIDSLTSEEERLKMERRFATWQSEPPVIDRGSKDE